MSPGRGAEEQSGAAQQAEGEDGHGHHPRHGLQLPGARGRYGHPSSPQCPRGRKETLLGDFPGLWDGNLWAAQHMQAQPAPPRGGCGASCCRCCRFGQGRGCKEGCKGAGCRQGCCAHGAESSLRGRGPGSVPGDGGGTQGTIHLPRDGMGRVGHSLLP